MDDVSTADGIVFSPSCRVVTESVSMLKTLSPMSLVASIRSLYEVKGFNLQTEDGRSNMQTALRFSSVQCEGFANQGTTTTFISHLDNPSSAATCNQPRQRRLAVRD